MVYKASWPGDNPCTILWPRFDQKLKFPQLHGMSMDPRDKLSKAFWSTHQWQVRGYLALFVAGALIGLGLSLFMIASRYDVAMLLVIKSSLALKAYISLLLVTLALALCGMAWTLENRVVKQGAMLVIILFLLLLGGLIVPSISENFCERLIKVQDQSACYTYLAVDSQDFTLCQKIELTDDRERCDNQKNSG